LGRDGHADKNNPESVDIDVPSNVFVIESEKAPKVYPEKAKKK